MKRLLITIAAALALPAGANADDIKFDAATVAYVLKQWGIKCEQTGSVPVENGVLVMCASGAKYAVGKSGDKVAVLRWNALLQKFEIAPRE